MGIETRKAVRRYQREKGLKVDGIVGGKTKLRIEQDTVAVQKFLQRQGPSGRESFFEDSPHVPGVWGTRTTAALERFQVWGAQQGYKVGNDGVLGPKTKQLIATEAMQEFLFVMGFYEGVIDGGLGKKTAAAIKVYQQARDIIESEVPDPGRHAGLLTEQQMEEDAKDLQR
jgi:peptidoglycan hydrolase-like protein with peptidoglycan-binding domain